MYAHFDFDKAIDVTAFHKLNSFLPKDIVFTISCGSSDDAAVLMQHKNLQSTTLTLLRSVLQEQSWYFYQKLDIVLMNEAAMLLFKHTNFQCFQR
jgi:tRNA pseudouridine38-40 synthase